jgi:hypothetical protein
VGEALCAEHGRKLKDGADYAKYMLMRDKHGGWQWSTSVEVCALATIMCSIVIVWTRTPDGSLALRDLYELLETVVDRCRDTGNVVMHIVLKNS